MPPAWKTSRRPCSALGNSDATIRIFLQDDAFYPTESPQPVIYSYL
jgi:hypothetical protein